MSESQVDLVEQQFELGVVKKRSFKSNVANGQARVDVLSKKVNYEIVEGFYLMIWVYKDFGQKIIAVDDEWALLDT